MMDHNIQKPNPSGFPERLRQIIAEFGSRYALAKSSRIPMSSLQSYEAGSKPGIDALTTLSRVANVDLNWLATGQGQMRPPGLISGAALAEIVAVFQYEIGSSLNIPMVIGQVPFSCHYLETVLRLNDPNPDSLLVVEADANLATITRGDLVLVDRQQKGLERDGIYLFDLPGMVLRAVTRCIGDRVRVMGPDIQGRKSSSSKNRRDDGRALAKVEEFPRSHLLGFGPYKRSLVLGRAVWVGRAL